MSLLSLRNVGLRFGGIVALDDFSIDVNEGQIVGLIGPNGAGKTTAFNVITRIYEPDRGDVEFEDQSLLKTNAPGIVRRGIARTFQNLELFPTMSVLENVLVGAHTVTRFKPERKARQLAMETIDYVGLGPVARRPAIGLPFATLKRVERARARATQPRVLQLDEVAGGLTEHECTALVDLIRDIRRGGISIIWIEHVVHALVALVDRLVVLHGGGFIGEGTPQTVIASPAVRDIYMGIPADA
jgi:branched-chain amino acid transport system ATP-binding protein